MLLQEEKDKLLDLVEELYSDMEANEKNAFANIEEISHHELDLIEIKEAKLRDLKREVEHIHEPNYIEYEENSFEKRKQRLLSEITILCPQLLPIFEKIEYSYWNSKKIERALPEDIMTAYDWQLFFDFMFELIS